MATLGQKPATQHVSTEKQTLTGNGGTSYTLQQSVSQAADIEVFVNNTRQEPTVAYTASGNTLTMTGAVNASDSFYVIFQGKAIQTAGLPVDAAITASTITASQSLNVTGHGSFTRGSDTALSLNRETSDGTIVDLQKDGTTVGSIGVADSGDRIYLAGGGLEGVGIDNGANAFVPTSEAGAFKDNHLSLGTSSARFENLYLSGGAYMGGTGSANYLDDYEEGTWTPELSSGNSSTYDNRYGRYTKVGRLVTAHFTLEIGNTFAGGTAQYLIGGLPFARSNEANSPSGSGIVHYFENIATTAHALTLRVDSGQSVMYITGAVSADGATGLSVNANVLQAQANLYGSVFYYTN